MIHGSSSSRVARVHSLCGSTGPLWDLTCTTQYLHFRQVRSGPANPVKSLMFSDKRDKCCWCRQVNHRDIKLMI